MYDRAIIIEKGRAAKTNFPLIQYEAEVAQYQGFCRQRWVAHVWMIVPYLVLHA